MYPRQECRSESPGAQNLGRHQYIREMNQPCTTSDLFPIPASDEALLKQCRVDTFRSGGKGGQHQNTTDSGVRMVHEPTGVRAASRNERSQHRNRAIALERLRKKLEKRNSRRRPRVSTRIPGREKRKRLDEKRRRAQVKDLRRQPRAED
jgi:protein subunit release factor A